MDTVDELMTSNPVVVRKDTSLAECAEILARNRFRHLPVVDGHGKLVAVLTDFGVFQRGGLAGANDELWVPFDDKDADATAWNAAEPAELVARPDQDLVKVLRKMAQSPYDVVVVTDDDDHPIGILTEHDAVRLAQGVEGVEARFEESSPVKSVKTSDPASTAWDLMVDQRVRHLVVMEGSRLYGVLSYRDLIEDHIAGARPVECREVVRSTEPITAAPGTRLAELAALMVAHKIGCIPIVNERGRPEAVITRTDLIEALITALQDEDLFPESED